jgi:uncharacterized RDD family membrane protein YckC
LDAIVLTALFFILGFVFLDFAYSLGPWGRVLGYSISFVYWAYWNSHLGKGQTPGKRVMKIGVVDDNGACLPVDRAIARSAVIALIFLLNGLQLPQLQNAIVQLVTATLLFGGGLAVLYGFIFNRNTRQGLHDLLAQSYVVKIPVNQGAIAPILPQLYKQITFGLVGIGLVSWASESCRSDQDYCKSLLQQIARTALANYDGIDTLARMQILVSNRFDLGFAQGTTKVTEARSIEEWRRQLEVQP